VVSIDYLTLARGESDKVYLCKRETGRILMGPLYQITLRA
jgi:hypothetical protein